jgi:hypothetical protein
MCGDVRSDWTRSAAGGSGGSGAGLGRRTQPPDRNLADAAELDPDVAHAWTLVRCIDYWLWGLGAGFTEDPLQCEAIVDVFAPRADSIGFPFPHARRP